MTRHCVQHHEMALILNGGRVSKSDCGRLAALLKASDIKDVSIRPSQDNLAISFPPPYGEKAVLQVCRFISNWRTKDPIIIQVRRQSQNIR